MSSKKSNTGHGALFDSFPDRPSSLHGGAKFDEGFPVGEHAAPKGPLFDQFGQPEGPDQGGHGVVWDEFGWKEMPDIHGGLLYDDGFGTPSSHETSRGPLFDLFEPSTQVKFIFDGQDAEGIIDHVRSDGVVMVTPRRGGAAVEVGLEQFLAYKSPSVDNVGTTLERSEAEAPSAWSPTARGGDHNTVPVPSNAGQPASAPDPGTPVEATPQGQATEPRSSEDVDWSPIKALKTALGEEPDVTKAAGPSVSAHHIAHLKVGDAPLKPTPFHEIERIKPAGVRQYRVTRKRLNAMTPEAHVYHDEPADVINHMASMHALKHEALKTDDSPLDVLKARLGITATPAPAPARTPVAKTMRLPSGHVIAKEVTVAETAVQAQEGRATLAGGKGAGSYCPECRAQKGKLTDDGRCPDCNMVLDSHTDGRVQREKGDGNGDGESSAGPGVGKTDDPLAELRKAFGGQGDPVRGGNAGPIGNGVTWDGSEHSRGQQRGQAESHPPDEPVEERPHKDSDHHTELGEDTSAGQRCPHCGEPLAALDAKTDQGAPSKPQPGGAATHKCLGSFLDTLKTAPEAAEPEPSAFEQLRELVSA